MTIVSISLLRMVELFFGMEAKGAGLDNLDLSTAKYLVSLYKQVECLVLPVLGFRIISDKLFTVRFGSYPVLYQALRTLQASVRGSKFTRVS